MPIRIPVRKFTAEEKREHALAYIDAPHGTKAAYLKEHGISNDRMRSWRSALAGGDIDHGIIPRNTVHMSKSDAAEVRRLQKELEQLRQRNARLEKDLAREQNTSQALGKAIGVMQKLGGADSDAEK